MYLVTQDHNAAKLILDSAFKKPKVWVCYDLFCKAAENISDYNKKNFRRSDRVRWRFNSKNEVDLNSICPGDWNKYVKLESIEKCLEYIEVLKKEAAEKKASHDLGGMNEQLAYQLFVGMKIQIDNEFPHYFNRIKEKYPTLKTEQCKEYSKRWAAMEWIIPMYEKYDRKYRLEMFAGGWVKNFPTQFKESSENHKISFYNLYKKCFIEGVENTIVNLKSVKKVQTRRSEFQMVLLQTLYIQSRKITGAEAYRKLNTACAEQGEKPMSSGNVKIIFREFEKNVELYKLRYGQAAAQKQLPYASLLPAIHRNTQWQIDGVTMPFWGANFQRYVLYLIRDNHSRKIVGWSMAESENTTLILDGLDDAMRNTGVFPGELVSDQHSFHRTNIAARLRAETEKMGAVWTVTINAQRNQLAERYNQYLDGLCKDFAGYLGKNMTATGKDARPSPETLTQYAKTANFKTADEIKAIAAYVIKEFNNMKLEPLEGLSPNEKYAASEDVKCFKISETERINLLRPATAYKVTRGQINIKVGMKKHEFQLPAELINRYNKRKVLAIWEDLEQGIYISDISSGEELGCIMPKQKMHGAIPDQTDADRKRLNQLTGRTNGVTTKARKNAQERIAEALVNNPEAIYQIEAHALPKDVRQIALQDAELKRSMAEQGIKQDMIPIRAQKAETITPATKSKERPYTDRNHVISKLSAEELYNAVTK